LVAAKSINIKHFFSFTKVFTSTTPIPFILNYFMNFYFKQNEKKHSPPFIFYSHYLAHRMTLNLMKLRLPAAGLVRAATPLMFVFHQFWFYFLVINFFLFLFNRCRNKQQVLGRVDGNLSLFGTPRRCVHSSESPVSFFSFLFFFFFLATPHYLDVSFSYFYFFVIANEPSSRRTFKKEPKMSFDLSKQSNDDFRREDK